MSFWPHIPKPEPVKEGGIDLAGLREASDYAVMKALHQAINKEDYEIACYLRDEAYRRGILEKP